MGHDLHPGRDPQAAIDLLAQGQRFDVAVLDFHMPDLDGAQLAQRLHDLPAGWHLPFVMLTSLDWRPPAGSDLFAATLTKPVRAKHLRAHLETILAPTQSVLAQIETTGGRRAGDQPPALEHPATGPVAEAKSEAVPESVPLRVLVAEDNTTNQQVARLMISRLGHHVDIVSNGIEAVDAVNRAPYDLVLMDLHMPDMDGLEATRRIRAEAPGGRREVPIIAMTASAMAEDHTACLEAGMNDFLSKPVRKANLIDTLTKIRPHRQPSTGDTPATPHEDTRPPATSH